MGTLPKLADRICSAVGSGVLLAFDNNSLAVASLLVYLISLTTHGLLQIIPRSSRRTMATGLSRKKFPDLLGGPTLCHENSKDIAPAVEGVILADLLQCGTNWYVDILCASPVRPVRLRSTVLAVNDILCSESIVEIIEDRHHIAP